MLTHLEFEQIKRALERMRSQKSGNYEPEAIKREDVVDVLIPYVEGYKAPDPHAPPPAVTA